MAAVGVMGEKEVAIAVLIKLPKATEASITNLEGYSMYSTSAEFSGTSCKTLKFNILDQNKIGLSQAQI